MASNASRTSSRVSRAYGAITPLQMAGCVVGPRPDLDSMKRLSGVPCNSLEGCPRAGRAERVCRTTLDAGVRFAESNRATSRRKLLKAAAATGAMYVRSYMITELPVMWVPDSWGITAEDLDSAADADAWRRIRRCLAAVDGQVVGGIGVRETYREIHLWIFADYLTTHVEVDREPAIALQTLLRENVKEVLAAI